MSSIIYQYECSSLTGSKPLFSHSSQSADLKYYIYELDYFGFRTFARSQLVSAEYITYRYVLLYPNQSWPQTQKQLSHRATEIQPQSVVIV